MIQQGEYAVNEPQKLETPVMLVFEGKVDHNIRTMCELAGGGENLMVHVKTHKSSAITRKKIEAGVAGLKCATLKELEMVLEAGADEAVMAYPLMQKSKAERLAELIAVHPESRVYATVSTLEHVELLAVVSGEREQSVDVLIDIDIGTHRTGVSPEGAEALFLSTDELPFLNACGFHLYDGHEHYPDPEERAGHAQRHIDMAADLKGRLESASKQVSRMVGGNTFTFPYYARTEGMHGSPGTCTYWDVNYSSVLTDMPFEFAALVLTQVVDRHTSQRTITTDLGIKAIPADSALENRARILGPDSPRLVKQNEEHGVFECAGELPPVGSYLLAAPGHACPTAMLYPGSFVMNEDGDVTDFFPHTARDRR